MNDQQLSAFLVLFTLIILPIAGYLFTRLGYWLWDKIYERFMR